MFKSFDVIPSVVPKRHYFWNLIGAGIGAAASHINSLYNANQNRKMQERAMRWQTSEREAQQEYQTSERIDQNNWSQQMYKNYSSPQAMARQFADAGLNPRLAADGSSVGSVTSGSGSNGGAPSGQSAPASPYLPVDGLASGFGNIASALAAIGQAKKAGVETHLLEDTFNDLVAQSKFKTESDRLMALFEKPADVLLKQKGVTKLMVDIANGALQGSEIRERIRSLHLQNEIGKNELDHWLETYEANLAKVKADTDLTNAKTQESKDAHELFPLNKKALERTNNLLFEQVREKRISNEVAEETRSAQIQITKALATRGTHEAVLAYQKTFEQFISNVFYKRYGVKEFNSSINITAAAIWEAFQGSGEYLRFTNDMHKAFGFNSARDFRDFIGDFSPEDVNITPPPRRTTEPHDH